MNDLFLHTLRDIYYAENKNVQSLPEMIENVTDKQLTTGLEGHLEETHGEVIVSTAPKRSGHEAVDMTSGDIFRAGDPARGDRTATEAPRRSAERKAPAINDEQIRQKQHAERRTRPALSGEPVEQPSAQTVRMRQSTGPRATVSVLFASLQAAIVAVAGALLFGYFVFFG